MQHELPPQKVAVLLFPKVSPATGWFQAQRGKADKVGAELVIPEPEDCHALVKTMEGYFAASE